MRVNPRPVCTGGRGGDTRQENEGGGGVGGARAGACQRAAAAGAAVRAAGACNFRIPGRNFRIPGRNFRIPGRTPLLFLGSTPFSLSRCSSSDTCAAHAQRQAPQRARGTRDSPGQGGARAIPPRLQSGGSTEGVYSRDMGRGNSREGGGRARYRLDCKVEAQQRECTVGTWVGATVGRGGADAIPPRSRWPTGASCPSCSCLCRRARARLSEVCVQVPRQAARPAH